MKVKARFVSEYIVEIDLKNEELSSWELEEKIWEIVEEKDLLGGVEAEWIIDEIQKI